MGADGGFVAGSGGVRRHLEPRPDEQYYWVLDSTNRVCVALSRHVDLLIIVGHYHLFVQRNNNPWSQLKNCKDIQICPSVNEATASFLSGNPKAKEVTPATASTTALKKRKATSHIKGHAVCLNCKQQKNYDGKDSFGFRKQEPSIKRLIALNQYSCSRCRQNQTHFQN